VWPSAWLALSQAARRATQLASTSQERALRSRPWQWPEQELLGGSGRTASLSSGEEALASGSSLLQIKRLIKHA
jgi:hypothetical protein